MIAPTRSLSCGLSCKEGLKNLIEYRSRYTVAIVSNGDGNDSPPTPETFQADNV